MFRSGRIFRSHQIEGWHDFPLGRLVRSGRSACRPPWETIATWPAWPRRSSVAGRDARVVFCHRRQRHRRRADRGWSDLSRQRSGRRRNWSFAARAACRSAGRNDRGVGQRLGHRRRGPSAVFPNRFRTRCKPCGQVFASSRKTLRQRLLEVEEVDRGVRRRFARPGRGKVGKCDRPIGRPGGDRRQPVGARDLARCDARHSAGDCAGGHALRRRWSWSAAASRKSASCFTWARCGEVERFVFPPLLGSYQILPAAMGERSSFPWRPGLGGQRDVSVFFLARERAAHGVSEFERATCFERPPPKSVPKKAAGKVSDGVPSGGPPNAYFVRGFFTLSRSRERAAPRGKQELERATCHERRRLRRCPKKAACKVSGGRCQWRASKTLTLCAALYASPSSSTGEGWGEGDGGTLDGASLGEAPPHPRPLSRRGERGERRHGARSQRAA